MEKKKYPIGPEHYTLYEEVGQGVSASVQRALCKPFNEVVAIKILDFERDNCDLDEIVKSVCAKYRRLRIHWLSILMISFLPLHGKGFDDMLAGIDT
uniref:Protein kinase domain-containing protein n=1 Tax=Fagus sylvatica TaxID=28930 RepID=A0A2N9GMS7_FAGSY